MAPSRQSSQNNLPRAEVGAESSGDEVDPETDNESADEGPKETPTVFKKLHFKQLEKLNSAIRNHGPNAPFTLSLLESLSGGGYLTPNEWLTVAQSILTRGQFLSWQDDWADCCRSQAQANISSVRSPSNKWMLDKLLGRGKYAPDHKQFSLGLLAQSSSAAMAAWWNIPIKGSVLSP